LTFKKKKTRIIQLSQHKKGGKEGVGVGGRGGGEKKNRGGKKGEGGGQRVRKREMPHVGEGKNMHLPTVDGGGKGYGQGKGKGI